MRSQIMYQLFWYVGLTLRHWVFGSRCFENNTSPIVCSDSLSHLRRIEVTDILQSFKQNFVAVCSAAERFYAILYFAST